MSGSGKSLITSTTVATIALKRNIGFLFFHFEIFTRSVRSKNEKQRVRNRFRRAATVSPFAISLIFFLNKKKCCASLKSIFFKL